MSVLCAPFQPISLPEKVNYIAIAIALAIAIAIAITTALVNTSFESKSDLARSSLEFFVCP
jgi:hypothetical protein